MKKEIKIRKQIIEKFTYKHELMEYQTNHPDCYIFKNGNFEWCALKNWTKFIGYYERLVKSSLYNPKIYELIPLTGSDTA